MSTNTSDRGVPTMPAIPGPAIPRRIPRSDSKRGFNFTATCLRLLAFFFRPATIYLIFVFLGVVLWLAPPDYGGGFRVREPLTLSVISVLLAWYGNVYLFASFGEYAAKGTRPFQFPRIDETTFYLILTGFSIIGVVAAYRTVIDAGISPVDAISEHNANEMSYAVQDDNSPFHTLRYSSSLAGGMAIFYMVFRRRWGLIELLNISLLLAAAVMSLRLLLVQAVITALGLALRFGGLERIRAMRVLVFGALTFAALTLMTWSREAGLYGKLVGTDNPLMMQYMQIKRYLGAPIQVSLGVARLIWEDKHANPKNMKYWKPVTPTFLHPQKEKDYSRGTGIWLWYEDNVDIDKGLTTNSAMAAIYPDMGLVIFPFMSLLSFVGAWVYGRFWTSDGPLVMIALVVLYGFFELWRTYVFNNGFFIFQLTEIGLASVIGAVVYRFRLDYSQALPGWRNSQSRNA